MGELNSLSEEVGNWADSQLEQTKHDNNKPIMTHFVITNLVWNISFNRYVHIKFVLKSSKSCDGKWFQEPLHVSNEAE